MFLVFQDFAMTATALEVNVIPVPEEFSLMQDAGHNGRAVTVGEQCV